MADDDLLLRLSTLAREQEDEPDGLPSSDDRRLLEQLVEGKLGAAQLRELNQRASRDAELAFALSTHTPLGPELAARIVERARAELPARLTPAASPQRKRPWLGPASVFAAAAAGLMIWLAGAQPAALPRYSLSHSGGLESVRGAARQTRLTLAADSPLTLLLRPAHDVEGDVELWLLIERRGHWQRVDVAVERSQSGTLRVSSRAKDVFGREAGTFGLAAIVCRPGDCADAQRELAESAPSRERRWQVEQLSVVYEP